MTFLFTTQTENTSCSLAVVLSKLQKNHLYVNYKKCQLCCGKVEYVGRWVLEHGTKANGEKIWAMMEWSFPTNMEELCEFFRLTSYTNLLWPIMCRKWFPYTY